MPATAHRFLVGFYGEGEDVRSITQDAVEKMGGRLTAVNVYNEVKLLGCKYAWMAVPEESDLGVVREAFKGKTVVDKVPADWDEASKTFKQVVYLCLALERDGGKLALTKDVLSFLIKDLVGGVVIEASVRAVMQQQTVQQPLEALISVLGHLLTHIKIETVQVDAQDVADALKYCEVRRAVAAKQKEQQSEKQ
eukprot:TRINITY_DN23441_c0_g1_i1.p1 TRINITY_DN23441_c0_g1~~TRINITY_DN23441_c0_g1_i1.p1  ORF type:complete len:205 (+),score=75.79 TRINITY_DN23441_c0_g1_i1:34-615(+)